MTYIIQYIQDRKEIGSQYLGYTGDISKAIELAEQRIERPLEGIVFVLEKETGKKGKEEKTTYIYIVDDKYFKKLKDNKE